MADDDKTVVQDGGEEAPAEKSGSPMMKYIIMAGIVIVMAGAGYFVTLKFIKPMLSDNEAATLVEQDSEGGDSHAKKSKKKRKKREAKNDSEGSREIAYIFEVENIIVNPAGTGGTRFLSASVGFELAYEDLMPLFKARQAQIRDALITILGSKNIEQLTDMKQKEIARLQIKRRVEQLLETDELIAVYFTDFVIQ